MEECILCGLKERGSILLLKEPEHVLLCINCNNNDKTIYDTSQGQGRHVYIIGKGIVDDQGNPID